MTADSQSRAAENRRRTDAGLSGRRRRRGAKWTVMVFMGADTIAGNSFRWSRRPRTTSREMEHRQVGRPLNIFAQVHGKGVPRRSHVGGSANPRTSRSG